MPRWGSGVLLLNVVAECLIVVTGGVVRLTGSGLGCPTWPQCVPGSYVPVVQQEQGFHKWIEFGNRTLTGLVGVIALACLIAVWRSRRRDLLPYVGLVIFGILAQAVIGGITVHMELAPGYVMTHFLVSMLLVTASTILWRRGREVSGPRTPVVRREVRGGAWLAAVLLYGVVVVGTVVTGSGPHSGDADEPARFGLDPQAVSWLHADLVMAYVGLLVGIVVALRATAAPRAARRASLQLLAATLLQGVVGYTQYFTDLPWVLVAIHMGMACLLVVLQVRLLCALTAPRTEVAAPPVPAAATA
ncbi:COX15/CtaA family protein [Kineococcus rubinsiae]|uniref:COX15/CtaA family protein n=1 Tax=Kineococcus rubinsiae TaxID=2609562 RepID=UPI00142FC5D5|nr:heme A synthase [Kineococcus rubinsiae]